MDQSTSLE
ncbi:hypothetical protein F383_37502 [Gossypium arboreum]|uniref:Uncharacterized protein n=1 Tax=Gossypium arboreum TaxID=29729 RepID=A0A0B0MDL7_GOSAR|nr:hypothetical protein F383_37502 [Gossypium arboreum]